MKKCLFIIFLIFSFLCFAGFELKNKSYFPVMDILEPDIIAVDLNKNGGLDFGEYICINDVKTYRKDFSNTDNIKLWFLADNFARQTLENKDVKVVFSNITTPECRFGEIIVDNQKYSQLLTNNNFNLLNQDKNSVENLLQEAEKLNPLIYNHKSGIYHKLDCMYGKVAHDTKILPKSVLEKSAKPCKFCHVSSADKSLDTLKTFPLSITASNIKLVLSDFTIKLKPDNTCKNIMCKTVLAEINNAKKSVEIAAYNFYPQQEIMQALKSAQNRGVRIRLIYDVTSKGLSRDAEKTVDVIKIIGVQNVRSDYSENSSVSSQLMHNKFMVFDNQKVLTGSMNFSTTGLSGFNNNNLILINSEKLAKIYSEEFEQMFSGKFHQDKLLLNVVQNPDVQVYFSPQSKAITNNILPLIESAKLYIYMPVFVLTHDELSKSLVEAKQRGVDVKIITDATNISAKRSKIKSLRNNGISIKVENYAGKMHSKSIIIDDEYLVIGSMNFSNSGENRNDENCLILKNPRITKFYKEYFEYLWNKIPQKYLTANPSAESVASIGSCSDGIDNDYDGKIDNQDEGCKTIVAK